MRSTSTGIPVLYALLTLGIVQSLLSNWEVLRHLSLLLTLSKNFQSGKWKKPFAISRLNRQEALIPQMKITGRTFIHSVTSLNTHSIRSLTYASHLGILFWTLLVGQGQMPFEGSPMEILHAIAQRRPMPVHEFRRDIPHVVAQIIEKVRSISSA